MADSGDARASKNELAFTFPEVQDPPPDGVFFTDEAYAKYSLFAEDLERPKPKEGRWLPSLEPLEPFSHPLADKLRLHNSRPSDSSTPAASLSLHGSSRNESQGAYDGQAAGLPPAGTSSSDASQRARDTSVAASHIGNFEARFDTSKDPDEGSQDGGWAPDNSDWGLDMRNEEDEDSQVGPSEAGATAAVAGCSNTAAGPNIRAGGVQPQQGQKRVVPAGNGNNAPQAKRSRVAAKPQAGGADKRGRGRPPKPTVEAPADASQPKKRLGRPPSTVKQAEWVRHTAIRPQPAQRRTDWTPAVVPFPPDGPKQGGESGNAVDQGAASEAASTLQKAPLGKDADLAANGGTGIASRKSDAAAPERQPGQWSRDLARGKMGQILDAQGHLAHVQGSVPPKLAAWDQARLSLRKAADLDSHKIFHAPAKLVGKRTVLSEAASPTAAADGPKQPHTASKAFAPAREQSGRGTTASMPVGDEHDRIGNHASTPPAAIPAHRVASGGVIEEIIPCEASSEPAGQKPPEPIEGKGPEDQQDRVELKQPAAASTWSKAEREQLWDTEQTRRKRTGQKAYEATDLFNPTCPIYDPHLERELKALQRVPGPLTRTFGPLKHQKTVILSCLTLQQHAWYLSNIGKWDTLQGEDAATLQQLQADVMREQLIWLRIATRIGAHEFHDRLLDCDPATAKQIEADAAAKRARVHDLPQYYRLQSNLHLAEVRFRERLELKHEVTVLAEAPKHTFHPVRQRYLFSPDKQYIPAAASGSDAGGRSSPAAKTATLEMSQDPKVLSASLEHKVSAAAPACSLAALVGLLEESNGPAWEIPVTVKELTGADGDIRKLAILEKPLLERVSSRREQRTRLFKWALLSVGLAGGGHQNAGEAELHASGPEEQPDLGLAGEKADHQETPSDKDSDGSLQPKARAFRLDVWELGRSRLLVRCHTSAVMAAAPVATTAACSQPSTSQLSSHPKRPPPASPTKAPVVAQTGSLPSLASRLEGKEVLLDALAGAAGQPVLVRSKLEYHPQRFEQGEMVTDGEVARWWLASHLRMGASVWVGHVGIPTCRCLSSELLSPASLNAEAAIKGIPARFAAWLKVLLDRLCTLKVGRYHVTHGQKSPCISIFEAVDASTTSKPLPLNGATASASAIFDLWAAHRASGGADPDDIAYIPLRWKAFDEKMAQIPYTFNPKPSKQKQKRHRNLVPSFITQGPGGGADWDDIEEQKLSGKFSKSSYAQSVCEEL